MGSLFSKINNEPKAPSVEETVYFASGDTSFTEEDFIKRMNERYSESVTALDDLTENAILINNINSTLTDQNVPNEIRESVIAQLSNSFGFSKTEITLNSFKKKRVVTRLSVGGFFRKIWEAILKFVRGFFKMVREFFNAVLGRSNDVEKKTKERQKTIDYIRRNNLKITSDSFRTIETRLPAMLNATTNNLHPSALVVQCENMLARYESLINKEIPVLMSTLEGIVLPSIEECLTVIDGKLDSAKDFADIETVMMNLLSACGSATQVILEKDISHTVLPEAVKDLLADKNIIADTRFLVRAYVDPNEAKNNLLCGFNVFSVVPMGKIDRDFVNAYGKDNLGFTFMPMFTAREELEASIIDPITSPQELHELMKNMSRTYGAVRINSVRDRASSLMTKFERAINRIERNMARFAEVIERAVKDEFTPRDFYDIVMVKILSENPNEALDIMSDIEINNPFITDENRDIVGALPYEQIAKDPDYARYVKKYMEGDKAINVTKYIDSVPLTDEEAERFAELPKLLNEILIVALKGVQTSIKSIAVDNISLYDLFRKELDAYTEACTKQFV